MQIQNHAAFLPQALHRQVPASSTSALRFGELAVSECLKGRRIVIVEDNDLARSEFFNMGMRHWGMEHHPMVQAARDYSEGLKMALNLAQSHTPPDFYVLDFHLTNHIDLQRNGLRIAQKLIQSGVSPKRIIICSCDASDTMGKVPLQETATAVTPGSQHSLLKWLQDQGVTKIRYQKDHDGRKGDRETELAHYLWQGIRPPERVLNSKKPDDGWAPVFDKMLQLIEEHPQIFNQ